MKKPLIVNLLMAMALVAFAAGIAGIAAAAEPAAGEAETAVPEAAPPVATEGYAAVEFAGVQVFVDRRTGEIRQPTAAEARQIATELENRFGVERSAGKAVSAPAIQRLENGGKMVQLDPSLLSHEMVRIDADGNIVHACVDGADEAAAFLDGTESAAPAGVER